MSVIQNFRLIQAAANNDDKGFINLVQQASEKSYRILVNDAGEILLDPTNNIPEYERWL